MTIQKFIDEARESDQYFTDDYIKNILDFWENIIPSEQPITILIIKQLLRERQALQKCERIIDGE